MMDHTGDFSDNVAGLDTPELDVASNDHAIGEIVDAVSHSKAWSSTAIFIDEDDSQAGPDHVDSHRSPVMVIIAVHAEQQRQPYVLLERQRQSHDGRPAGNGSPWLNDANAVSMDDVFSKQPNLQPYDVLIPGALCKPPVDPTLVPQCWNPLMRSRITPVGPSLHSGKWWINATKGLSFRHPDEIDSNLYNRLLWKGIMGERTPYPQTRTALSIGQSLAALPTSGASLDP
jgi:DNA-binding beta-propeller fold protein YncE